MNANKRKPHAQPPKPSRLKAPHIVVKTHIKGTNPNPNVNVIPRYKIKHKYSSEIQVIFTANKNISNMKEAREYEHHLFSVLCFFSELIDLKINLKSVRNIQGKHLHAVFQRMMEDSDTVAFIKKTIESMRLFCHLIGKSNLIDDIARLIRQP